MIPESHSLDQSVIAQLLAQDALINEYRAFFSLFDWCAVSQWEAGQSSRGRLAHPEAAYLKVFLVRIRKGLISTSSLRRFLLKHEPDLEREAEQIALRDAIEDLILNFPGYGYRRVIRALQRTGWQVNHKRVLRIMREESLLCHLKHHFVRTTDSKHGLPIYPNLIAERTPQAPDEIWHADLTYIRLRGDFVYLACVIDGWSRRGVGWCLSGRMDSQMVLTALEQALNIRNPAPGLIHHSDQGVQYASLAYVERLQSRGLQISMSWLAVRMTMPKLKASSRR